MKNYFQKFVLVTGKSEKGKILSREIHESPEILQFGRAAHALFWPKEDLVCFVMTENGDIVSAVRTCLRSEC